MRDETALIDRESEQLQVRIAVEHDPEVRENMTRSMRSLENEATESNPNSTAPKPRPISMTRLLTTLANALKNRVRRSTPSAGSLNATEQKSFMGSFNPPSQPLPLEEHHSSSRLPAWKGLVAVDADGGSIVWMRGRFAGLPANRALMMG